MNRIIYITKSGAFIKFNFFDDNDFYEKINKIEKYFTIKKKQSYPGNYKDRFQCLKCCRMDRNNARIIVPRFGIFEILNDKFQLSGFTVKSTISPGDDINVEWKGKLTNNQRIIAKYILTYYYNKNYVLSGRAGCILNLEAGQGKSYLAAYLISVIKKKTAIIMHTTSLLKQWETVIRNTFGNDVNIGYYYGKKKSDGDIVLMIIDSSSNDEFFISNTKMNAIEYYNRYGFIIYDECHMYTSKTAQKTLMIAQTPYVLGLSATPDENTNGYDKAVWWRLGPVVDAKKIKGYEALSEKYEAVVHRVKYNGPEKYTNTIISGDSIAVAPTINMICEDNIRNFIIVKCIIEGLSKGLNMFVFSDRREHLLVLRRLLVGLYKITGELMYNDDDFIRIVGGDSDETLSKAEIKSRVIFTTYQFMGTGKSVVKMNGLVLATPRKSKMKQYINRIFRLGSDATIKRHIWDICDMKTKLSNQWNTRKRYYKSKDYEQYSGYNFSQKIRRYYRAYFFG